MEDRVPRRSSDRMSIRDGLERMGLPAGDLHELPTSEKRFPDGAHYRFEIPSTEGPRCLQAVLEEADRLDVVVHRVSQGSGVFMLTDVELDEFVALAAEANVELSLFARPNAGWDASADDPGTRRAVHSPRRCAGRTSSLRCSRTSFAQQNTA